MFLLSCSHFDQYYFRQVTKLIKDKIEIYYILFSLKKSLHFILLLMKLDEIRVYKNWFTSF